MLFNSLSFLLVFLPIVSAGFLLCRRFGNIRWVFIWLFICSAVFYGAWEPSYILLLFGSILVIPVFVVVLATAHGMQESMTVESCAACHVMESHIRDLRDPKSDSLAAVHFKNRYILENHCYTCHSDYGMFGTITTKIGGLRNGLHLDAHSKLQTRVLSCAARPCSAEEAKRLGLSAGATVWAKKYSTVSISCVASATRSPERRRKR